MSNETNIVDPKLEAEVGKAADKAKLQPVTATAVAALRRGGVSTVPRSLGYVQAPFIATSLLPEVQSSPDGSEVAYYPVWAKEQFVVPADDRVSIGGGTTTYDLNMSWSSCDLEVRAAQTVADPREIRIAAANNLDLASEKFDLARAKVTLNKEYTLATILQTSGNYTTTSALTSGGTGTRWDNYAASGGVYYSDPIKNIADYVETVRSLTGRRPNAMFMGASVWAKVRFHPILRLAVGGIAGPQMPISLESFAALVGLTVYVGEAITAASASGAFSDVWGKNVGFLNVSEGGFKDPGFGFTLTSSGYPKSLQERDINKGAEGSMVYRYIDAYKGKVLLADAGALYTTVIT